MERLNVSLKEMIDYRFRVHISVYIYKLFRDTPLVVVVHYSTRDYKISKRINIKYIYLSRECPDEMSVYEKKVANGEQYLTLDVP